jgi:hypothetical protein
MKRPAGKRWPVVAISYISMVNTRSSKLVDEGKPQQCMVENKTMFCRKGGEDLIQA